MRVVVWRTLSLHICFALVSHSLALLGERYAQSSEGAPPSSLMVQNKVPVGMRPHVGRMAHLSSKRKELCKAEIQGS